MIEPKLRFKADDRSQFPDWEEKKLAEMFKKAIEKNRLDLPPLTIVQGYGTIRRDESERRIAYDEKGLKNYKAVQKDDFIVHLRSFEGGLEIANQDGIVSPAYHVYRGNDEVHPSFYYPYFRSSSFIKGKLAICVTGVRDGKNIEMGAFDELLIPHPCLPEQQKIAEFLSTIDTVIQKQKETVSAWEERKKGVMQKLFSQEVRFKADDGSDFPEWEEKKLGEVSDIMTGNTPSTKQEDYYGGCYLWVTPTDITDSREVSVTAKKLTELGYTVARHIPANSVLVTCIASIGKNAIIRENGSCNQQINSITPYNDYSVEFVYYLICQNERLLHANAGAGGMEILNKDSFSKIKMYFPCLAEQQKIADCLSSLDEVIEKQKATLAAWEELKKGLLQQMFV